jgi:hypothetical protein
MKRIKIFRVSVIFGKLCLSAGFGMVVALSAGTRVHQNDGPLSIQISFHGLAGWTSNAKSGCNLDEKRGRKKDMK